MDSLRFLYREKYCSIRDWEIDLFQIVALFPVEVKLGGGELAISNFQLAIRQVGVR